LSELLTGRRRFATSTIGRGGQAAVEFARTNDRLEIVAVAMGDTMLNADGIKALAELPSLDSFLPGSSASSSPGDQDRAAIQRAGAQLARASRLCGQGSGVTPIRFRFD